jgi:hypothetical protein
MFAKFGTTYVIKQSSLNLEHRAMNTSRLFFSIFLLALGTTAFSQDSFSGKMKGLEIIQVKYTAENSKIAHRVGDFLDNFLRPEKTISLEPVVCMSFILDRPDIVYEEVYCLESWMTTPFRSGVQESKLNLEPWMGKPFNCNIGETGLHVESWMTTAWL